MSKNAEVRAIHFERKAAELEKQVAALKNEQDKTRRELELLARETLSTFNRVNSILQSLVVKQSAAQADPREEHDDHPDALCNCPRCR
jgi:hypothetical protein